MERLTEREKTVIGKSPSNIYSGFMHYPLYYFQMDRYAVGLIERLEQ